MRKHGRPFATARHGGSKPSKTNRKLGDTQTDTDATFKRPVLTLQLEAALKRDLVVSGVTVIWRRHGKTRDGCCHLRSRPHAATMVIRLVEISPTANWTTFWSCCPLPLKWTLAARWQPISGYLWKLVTAPLLYTVLYKFICKSQYVHTIIIHNK